ncbi:MAG: hypothetical protein Q8R60_14840 [Mycobacteriales bacterium]|nr:hypothetical protein [Mycobacteriales bacterium]
MSETHPDQSPDPTGKQLRDARRHAHGVQKDSKPEGGGSKKDRKGMRDKKGRKGKGDPKP